MEQKKGQTLVRDAEQKAGEHCCPRMKPASSRATNNGMKETWHAYGIPVRITIVITIIGVYGGGEKFAINR